jgi:methyl-accepting chemotaxis protein
MLLRMGQADAVAKARSRWEGGLAQADKLLTTLGQRATTPAERDSFTKALSNIKAYREAMGPVVPRIVATEFATQGEADKAVNGAANHLRELEPLLNEAVKRAQAQTTVLAGDFERRAQGGVMIAIVAGVLSLVIGIGATVWLIRSTMRPLADATAALERLAQGDLTIRATTRSDDEFGRMMSALQRTVDSLAGIVGRVQAGVDSVSTASREIAQGNQDLSARTENQASSLQQTAASMEEMTSTLQASAENARSANQRASEASRVAAHGGSVVAEVVTTMEAISDSSRRIGDIIGVIDGIAFQTNILALNAAVEAARAGEQGRGFAVVAGEVRSLAQRSAEAAREIKSLIAASVERVDAGQRHVQEAGRTMQDLVGQVQAVSALIAEISDATGQQSAGIVQVNQAIGQIDQMTQQNAALVEQSAAAAESLRTQAGQLSQAVQAFRVAPTPA